MNHLFAIIDHNTYRILFLVIVLELIAIPLSSELVMTYVGYLIYLNHASFIIALLIAFLASLIGVTFTYAVGRRIGFPLIEKYGPYIRIRPDQYDKIVQLFNKKGGKLLLFTYYIPGLRQLSGYTCGILKMPYTRFSTFAYLGALLWCITFITLGKFVGTNFVKYHALLSNYVGIALLIFILMIIGFYGIKRLKSSIKAS